MNEDIQAAADGAVLEAEIKANCEHAMQIGIFACWFTKGARLSNDLSFDEAVQLYGTYIEAMASGNHCHGEATE